MALDCSGLPEIDMIEPHALALSGDRQRAMRWLAVLATLPVPIAAGALWFALTHGSATRVPPPWPLVVAIPLLVMLVQFLFVRSLNRAGVFVAEGELIVRTGVGTKRIALSRLRKHGLRRVNLDTDSQL